MSYPPPTYHGSTGEVFGRLRRAAAPRELPSASYLATGASTGGEFGLYRWDMEPNAGGTTPTGSDAAPLPAEPAHPCDLSAAEAAMGP